MGVAPPDAIQATHPKAERGRAVGGTSLGYSGAPPPSTAEGADGLTTPANCRPPPPICAGVAPPDASQTTHPKAARGRAVCESNSFWSLPIKTELSGWRSRVVDLPSWRSRRLDTSSSDGIVGNPA